MKTWTKHLFVCISLLGHLNKGRENNPGKEEHEYEFENDKYCEGGAREAREETGLIENDDFVTHRDISMEYVRTYFELGAKNEKTTKFFAAEMHTDKFHKEILLLATNQKGDPEHRDKKWMTKDDIEKCEECIPEFKERIDEFEAKIRSKKPEVAAMQSPAV